MQSILVPLQHIEEGYVGMSNKGSQCPNSNNSQFYITTAPSSHLDGLNVIVGKVVKGLNIIIEMFDVARVNDIPLEVKIAIFRQNLSLVRKK